MLDVRISQHIDTTTKDFLNDLKIDENEEESEVNSSEPESDSDDKKSIL